MPGILMMEPQQQIIGSENLKKESSHAEGGDTAQKQETVKKLDQNVASLPNGVATRPSNTGPKHGLSTPPELDQSWRESDANKSMGVLVERLAQQCFGDLNEALTKMAEVPEPAAQANGIAPLTTDKFDKSEASLSKKRTLMEFANNQRDRFIKTLVLSDWARNADDMARLVDLKVWQEKQVAAQNNAMRFIAAMKLDMAGAKMPNPNIEGALELLATGKASRTPDLGYLPAKRLTAKQLLRTLQDMNVILATRLNLHEDLPFHFNDFSISNGRATFRVPGEFEADLSVADEDPSSPFYFIDIRFLFSPTPSLSDEGLRGVLEERVNYALSADGPKACYELLHNFVLTHKINMLRDQAIKILKEKWFDCLSIEMKKRVLIIQYWSGMPGPKSWLEVGVSTGKTKSKRLEPATPQINVRWFRKGREAVHDDDAIDIDWQDISAANVLAITTAKHVSWTLTTVRDRLHALPDAKSKFTATLTTSAWIPEDCSLSLSLPGLRTPLTVRVSGVTGKWSLSPQSSFTARTELALNADPNMDPVSSLTRLVCSLVQERVAKASDLAGWRPVSRHALVPLPPASVTALFGSGVISRSIFRCSIGWGESWALIATFGLDGEKLWAARLERHVKLDGTVDPSLRVIAEARPISANVFDTGNVSRAQLLRVEKLAAAEISLAVLTQELREQNIRYKVEATTPLTTQPNAADTETASHAVVFDAAHLGKMAVDSPLRHFKADVIRLTHTGVSVLGSAHGELANMRHSLRLTAKPGALERLQAQLTTKSRNADIAMNKSGALALQLRTPFGERYMHHIRSRLEACARLNEYLAILSLYEYEVLSLSLEKFSFVYSNSPRLSATFRCASSCGGLPVKLRLHPTDRNPQYRARTHLEWAFNSIAKQDAPRAFLTMIRILSASLPAYQAFDKIEALQPMGSTTLHIRNPLAFVLEYNAPLPACVFKLHLGNKGKVFTWNVSTPLVEDDGRGLPDPLRFALLRLCQDSGEGWFGDGQRALVVGSAAIAEVLMKIDEILRGFGPDDAKSEPNGLDAAAANSKMEEVKQEANQETRQLLSQPLQGHDTKPIVKQQLGQRNGPPIKQQQLQQQRPAPPGTKSSNVKQEVIELD